MRTGKPITLLLAVVALLSLLIATTVLLAQESDDPAQVDLNEIKEDTIRELFDDKGNMVTPDDRLASVARTHKGGFGGFYFHEEDNTIAYVFMMDTSDPQYAEDAFRSAYSKSHRIQQIIPVQGDYSFDELVEWYYLLNPALHKNDIRPIWSGVMELRNRIVFGLSDMSVVEAAWRIMDDLDIPRGAVVFEEDHIPDLMAGGDSVEDDWRPLVGGIRHQQETGGVDCTIGFVTERETV